MRNPATPAGFFMATNDKEVLNKNILPWIKDGSYKNDEWQRRIEGTLIEIRGREVVETRGWRSCARTAI